MADRRRENGDTSEPSPPAPGEPTSQRTGPRRVLMAVVTLFVLAAAGVVYRQSGTTQTLTPAIDVERGAAAGFNVVLITLDTLRADHLRCYGYQGVETPTLDGLATEGVRFVDAVTSVPMTLPSHCTIFTGMYPPRHGVRDNGTYRLVASTETLAERLNSAGYATAAFVGSFVLDKRYGLDQGFDVYNDESTSTTPRPGMPSGVPERTGDAVVDSAIRWLDEYDAARPRRPFFMWVHLFDAHTPYEPPEPFKTRYATNPYDGEIAFADAQVGRLLRRLGELKLLEKAIVVAVGDHGEGLGEHNETTHSFLIYESTMRVPLIFWSPPVIPKGQVVDDRLVATVDVMPTLLDLLGLDSPDCDGTSLLRSHDPGRVVYMETISPQLNLGWSPLFGSRRHHDKFIDAPTPEYYNLAADPGELTNLVAKRTGEAETLSNLLTALIDSFPSIDTTASVALDDETKRKLEALGYLGERKTPSTGRAIDPKDMLAAWEGKVATAVKLLGEGTFQAALPVLEGALAITPLDSGLWAMLGEAQTLAGRYEQAVQSYLRSIELKPNDAAPWLAVARLRYALGDRDAALIALDQAERLEPDNGAIYVLRAELARAVGKYEEALALCEKGRQVDPSRHTASSWILQGKTYEAMGRREDAVTSYQTAYDADPANPGALLGMAKVAEWNKKYNRAIELVSGINRGQTGWVGARTLLARAYMALEKGDQAVEVMREVIAAVPDHPPMHSTLGNYLYHQDELSEAADSYRRALQLNPNDARTQYKLAVVLSDQADNVAAIDGFEAALRIDPGLHRAQLALARIYAEQGEIDKGLSYLEQMLREGVANREQLEADPSLEPLTIDSRFGELVESLEFP